MFWAIASGITLGAKFFLPALLSTLIIGLLLLLLTSMKFRASMPYLLVIRFEEGATAHVNGLLRRIPDMNIKSKTVSSTGVEMTVELRLRDSDMQIVDRFLDIPGVFDAAIISYGGDIVA